MIRKDITYELLKPFLEEKPREHYHRACYQNYTHKQKLKRISSKRQLDNDGTSLDSRPGSSTSQPSPRKRRSLIVKTTISNYLMCQRDKYDKKKRSRENLTQLLTYDAAIKIQRAAQLRKDHRVLLQVGNRQPSDLIAMECKYHRSCYRDYTKPREIEKIARLNEDEEERSEYDQAFDNLAKEVNEKITDGMEIISMSVLREKFIELLREEGIDLETYRAEKLKVHLTKHFGERLGFWHPRYRVKSEIVCSNLIPKGMMMEEKQMHSQDQLNDEILDSCEISNYSEQSHNYVSDIYYSATFIRQEINKMKPYLPWPPSPEDIDEKNVQVPNALYNLLAWIFSGDNSKEPISEKCIQVSETVHKLVLSIAQDIVYVTSHGNIKNPKHVALPMTVQSKTGSSEIVTLLNQFGHGISYSVLREGETAMAERQTQETRSWILATQ